MRRFLTFSIAICRWFELLLCASSVFSVSLWWFPAIQTTETENTEGVQRSSSVFQPAVKPRNRSVEIIDLVGEAPIRYAV